MHTTIRLLKATKLCEGGFKRLVDTLGTINLIDQDLPIPIWYILKSADISDDLPWIMTNAYIHDEKEWERVSKPLQTAAFIFESFGEHDYPHHMLAPLVQFMDIVNPELFMSLPRKNMPYVKAAEAIRKLPGFEEAAQSATAIFEAVCPTINKAVLAEAFNIPRHEIVEQEKVFADMGKAAQISVAKGTRCVADRNYIYVQPQTGFRAHMELLPHYEKWVQFITAHIALRTIFANAAQFKWIFPVGIAGRGSFMASLTSSMVDVGRQHEFRSIDRALFVDALIDLSTGDGKLSQNITPALRKRSAYLVHRYQTETNLHLKKTFWKGRYNNQHLLDFWRDFAPSLAEFEKKLFEIKLTQATSDYAPLIGSLPRNKMVRVEGTTSVVFVVDNESLAEAIQLDICAFTRKSVGVKGAAEIEALLEHGIKAPAPKSFNSLSKRTRDEAYAEFLGDDAPIRDEDSDEDDEDDDESDESEENQEGEDEEAEIDDDAPTTPRRARPPARIRSPRSATTVNNTTVGMDGVERPAL